MSVGKGGRARGAQYRPRAVVMDGVTEHAEDYAVELDTLNDEPIVVAFNEAGYNSTAVDLNQLLAWLRVNRPDVLGPTAVELDDLVAALDFALDRVRGASLAQRWEALRDRLRVLRGTAS